MIFQRPVPAQRAGVVDCREGEGGVCFHSRAVPSHPVLKRASVFEFFETGKHFLWQFRTG